MTLNQFPVVSVKGKPFDCGQQHGSQARQQIHRAIDLYFHFWEATWGAKRSEVLKKCRGLVPVIGEYDADILEELEGVARGAELPIEEVIALNARYELSWAPSAMAQLGRDECTSIVALPEVTKGGHTILGENWDYYTRFQETCIILEIEQETKPNLVIHSQAGIIGFKGMNSAGIGVCVNALASNWDGFEPRVPIFIMMRGILNADNFSQALGAVVSTRAAVSANLLIAHYEGEAIDLELIPGDVAFLYPEEGILTHSNHFMAFNKGQDFKDILISDFPDSLFRSHRARRLLELDKGHIDVSSIQRVFKDHFSYPNSICRHVNPRDVELKQAATLTSIIMDLGERTIYLSEGPPCQNEYSKLSPRILLKD